MRKDHLMHLGGALGLMAYAALIVACYLHYGPGPTAALATTLGSAGVEFYQWIRKEGVPDPVDFLVTATPGYVVWAVLASAAPPG